ncbi:MAG: GTP cyclohydrolase I [Candidatus Hodgkinia cicadicola]|nr:MAG: GTP cyclohydrolase I [Candidatus Hodgkinia cicadicola]
MDALVRKLIENIGDKPTRPSLELTPHRVSKLTREIYYGYEPPVANITRSFDASRFGVDLVYVKNVFLCSTCEHHMMPFFGKASLAYAPAVAVVGLSKIVSALNYYSARLQSQERLAYQVFCCIKRELRPKALLLKMECKHLCMMVRGVKSVCGTAGSVVSCGLFNLCLSLKAMAIDALAD